MKRLMMVGLVIVVVGCGDSGPSKPQLPDLVPVSGTVTLDDKPLEDAVVIFIPKETGGFPAIGATNAQGEYKLQTRDGQKKMDGAATGEYRVQVSRFLKPDGTPLPPDPSEPPAMSAAVESLPPEYSSPNASELSATVGADAGTFDWKLKSK